MDDARWKLGDKVRKKRGSSWRGTVCGFYSTPHTPIGYCVDSAFEPGSVQVWPEAALEDWDGEYTPELLQACIDQLEAEREQMLTAIHDAIRRPLGVVPDSAVPFFDPRRADEAETRRRVAQEIKR